MVCGKGSLFAIGTLLLACSLFEWSEARCTRPNEDVGRRLRGFRDRKRHHGVRRHAWELGAGVYYEMDIMQRAPRQRNGVALTAFPNARWPNAVVPYVITGTFSASELSMIQQGMQQFASNTCVRFVPRTSEALYISIQSTATGCWSYVGRSTRNTENIVNFQTPDCMEIGTVTHELNHAIGFYHEFTRPDRDDWVSIDQTALADQYRNDPTFYADNYSKMAASAVVLYGRPYAYESNMHYSKYAAAKDTTRPVMNNLKPWTGDFGNDLGLSPSDIIDINYMYCNATSTTTAAPTTTTTTTTTVAPVTTTTKAATTTVAGVTTTTTKAITTTVAGVTTTTKAATTTTAAPVTTTTTAAPATTTTSRPFPTLFPTLFPTVFPNQRGIITTLVQGPVTRIIEFIRSLPIFNLFG